MPASSVSAAVLLPDAHPEAAVRAAIIRSLSDQRFETESEEAGFIKAKYQRGDRSIQISVEYTGSQYRVQYLDSDGFASQGKGNQLMLDSALHKQIGKLKKQIDRELTKSSAPAAADVQAAQAQAPVDNRNSGQVIVDIMQARGYACTVQDSRYDCTPPGDGWQLAVSYVIDENTGGNTIWFDSYANRAFAKPCSRFTAALNDLVTPEHSFSTTCDDGSQTFRFNSAVTYGPEMDVDAWLASHLDRRANAFKLLSSIGAIRR